MKNIDNKTGRPKLNINNRLLESEIKKYIDGQTGTITFRNLGIGKTSFYKILNERGIKRNCMIKK